MKLMLSPLKLRLNHRMIMNIWFPTGSTRKRVSYFILRKRIYERTSNKLVISARVICCKWIELNLWVSDLSYCGEVNALLRARCNSLPPSIQKGRKFSSQNSLRHASGCFLRFPNLIKYCWLSFHGSLSVHSVKDEWNRDENEFARIDLLTACWAREKSNVIYIHIHRPCCWMKISASSFGETTSGRKNSVT